MITLEFDPTTHAIVPLEPTEAMVHAARKDYEGAPYLPFGVYKRMIAASPDFVSIAAPAAPAQPVPDANVPKNKSDQQHSMISALNQVLERDALDAARYRFLEHQCRTGTYAGIISREAIDAARKGDQP